MNKSAWKIVIRPMGALAAAAILMVSVPSCGRAQVKVGTGVSGGGSGAVGTGVSGGSTGVVAATPDRPVL